MDTQTFNQEGNKKNVGQNFNADFEFLKRDRA